MGRGPVEDYSTEGIQAKLRTVFVGREIELYPQVNSTNDLVREAGKQGAPEGFIIVAEEQVRGRGRLGRTWTAPAGSSILCSVLLRPRFSPQQAFYLTIAASLAILRAVRGLTVDGGRWTVDGGQAKNPHSAFRIPHSAIKWPNDVLVNGRKVSGVLSEGEFVGGEWGFAIVGFGINVNLSGVELDGLRTLAPRATSLSAELGAEIDRAKLLARILEELEGLYSALQNGQFGIVHDEWVSKMETVGRHVLVDQGSERIGGLAVRVDADGALVVKMDEGSERRILAGDVV